jgi:hypothetical protein
MGHPPHLRGARDAGPHVLVLELPGHQRAGNDLQIRPCEEAKHQFGASWAAWKAWAKLAESKDGSAKPGIVAKARELLNCEAEEVMADKPRSFDEVAAATDSAERARIEAMESFVTDEGKVNLIVDPDEPAGGGSNFSKMMMPAAAFTSRCLQVRWQSSARVTISRH